MKILLTGATGFIGSHLLTALIKEKHNVSILIRQSSKTWRIKELLSQVSLVDEASLEQFFTASPPDLIFHLATHYVKSHQPEDVAKMIEGNIQLPSMILELAQQHGTKHFINIGTCFEYGPSSNAISETTRLDPYNLYASTKLAFEQILKFYTTHQNLRALTLRLFYPYGEADNQKVIPLMVKSLLSNEELVISKGEQHLDYTYVGDIVGACLQAIHFIASDNYKEYEVFNIGEGKGKQILQIAKILNEMHGRELIFCEKEYSTNEIMNMVANIDKAKTMLNWQPETPIEVGLQKVYQYYKDHYEQLNN